MTRQEHGAGLQREQCGAAAVIMPPRCFLFRLRIDPTAAGISSPCACTYTRAQAHTVRPSTRQRNTGMAPGLPSTLQLQQRGIFYAKPCRSHGQRAFAKKNPPVGCQGSERNLFKMALFQPRRCRGGRRVRGYNGDVAPLMSDRATSSSSLMRNTGSFTGLVRGDERKRCRVPDRWADLSLTKPLKTHIFT